VKEKTSGLWPGKEDPRRRRKAAATSADLGPKMVGNRRGMPRLARNDGLVAVHMLAGGPVGRFVVA